MLHVRGFKVHGMMVEQELLHLIHLQKMNCLISFTREMEEDINQERDNFQGLFYYLDTKQSHSVHRCEESVPFVFFPCALGLVLGSQFLSSMTEFLCDVCSRPIGLCSAAVTAQHLCAFLSGMFRKRGDGVAPPIPSSLSSWQTKK